MATSKVLTKTVGEIVAEALQSARIIPAEQTVQNADYERGLKAVNKICKYWQTLGVHLWLERRALLPLNLSQTTYVLGPDGDPCGNVEDTVYTTLTTAGVAADTVLTVGSTTGMVAAPNILESDPTDSTQDWTAINSATLSVSSGLRATNVGGVAGGASYSLDTTIGQTYRVKFGFTLGTSVSCTVSVLNGITVADTVTLSASDTDWLGITAVTDTITFKFVNTSVVAGEYSTIYDVEYVDVETGSRIGTVLTSNVRDWDYVYEVGSSTSVTLVTGLAGAAASGNTVISFPEQIDMPLRLDNMMYGSTISATEVPVSQWSRQEYFNQPDKTSAGSVVQWYYNPFLATGNLYVWQVASNVNNVVRFDYREPLTVYSDSSDELEIPEEYFMALAWCVAAELGPQYGVPDNRQLVIESKAAKYLEEALDNDAEEDSVYFLPDFTG